MNTACPHADALPGWRCPAAAGRSQIDAFEAARDRLRSGFAPAALAAYAIVLRAGAGLLFTERSTLEEVRALIRRRLFRPGA